MPVWYTYYLVVTTKKMSAKIAAILHCVTEQADMGVYLTTWINTHQLKDDLPQAIACSDCG